MFLIEMCLLFKFYYCFYAFRGGNVCLISCVEWSIIFHLRYNLNLFGVNFCEYILSAFFA